MEILEMLMKLILLPGKLLYNIFDLFPDIIKWFLIILNFILIYYAIFKIYKENNNQEGIKITLFFILLCITIILIGIMQSYFSQEVFVANVSNITSLQNWFYEIPSNIKKCLIFSNWYVIILFLAIIYLFDWNRETKSDNCNNNYNPDTWSARESRVMDKVQTIKDVRRNL